MKWQLRDYQRRFCRSIVDAFDGKVADTAFTKVLGTAATGAGKTIIASALIHYWHTREQRKCLFLADTDELCDQSLQKIHKSAGIIPDLEKAERRASRHAGVVVGSIQSLQNRLDRWEPDHFGYVIADEAHMSMAAGWQRTLGHFHAGGARILGITATPERGDKKSLMRFYEHLAAEIPMTELIKAKHLSPITVETVPLEIRIHGKISEGEQTEIAEELEAYYQAIIDAFEKHAGDRKKVLWFHPSVAASKRFSQLLMERGHSAAHVDGNSPDRAEIVEGFHRSRFRHLNNCLMLTKGFDCPDIDAIVILRPTKSRTAYIQMAGRGTRLFCPHGCTDWCDHPDRKQDMLLLDFLWEFEGHNVMGPADLITDAPEQREAVAKALKAGKPLDLLATDEFVTGEREADLLAKLKRQAGKRGSRVDALTFAALLHQPELMDYEPVAGWQLKPVSPAQAAMLEKAGIDPHSIESRGHASALGDALAARRAAGMATLSQVKWLNKFNVPFPHTLTFEQATATLDELFQKR